MLPLLSKYIGIYRHFSMTLGGLISFSDKRASAFVKMINQTRYKLHVLFLEFNEFDQIVTLYMKYYEMPQSEAYLV